MDLRQFCVDELHEYGVEIFTNFSPCSYTEIDHFFLGEEIRETLYET